MAEAVTVRDALPGFYASYGLEADGGAASRVVKIAFTDTLYVYFPNFPARRRALLKHDIHHLVTGYSGLLEGETEISTWEISSGCRSYWAALFINLFGMMMGVPTNFRGIWKAYKRGKHTSTLYADQFSNDEVLGMGVGEVRRALGLDREVDFPANWLTVLSFGFWLMVGTVVSVLSLFFLPAVLAFTVVVSLVKG
jgi:hypothetical protein